MLQGMAENSSEVAEGNMTLLAAREGAPALATRYGVRNSSVSDARRRYCNKIARLGQMGSQTQILWKTTDVFERTLRQACRAQKAHGLQYVLLCVSSTCRRHKLAPEQNAARIL